MTTTDVVVEEVNVETKILEMLGEFSSALDAVKDEYKEKFAELIFNMSEDDRLLALDFLKLQVSGKFLSDLKERLEEMEGERKE